MTLELILWACLAVVLYAAVANRFLKVADVFKRRATDAAGILLHDPRLSDERRRMILVLIPRLSHTRMAWILAFGVIPSTLLALWRRRGQPATDGYAGVPANQMERWKQMTQAAVLGAVLNSPLATMLLGVQILALTFLIPFARLADVLMQKSASALPPMKGDLASV